MSARKKIVVVEFNSNESRDNYAGLNLTPEEREKVHLVYVTTPENDSEVRVADIPGTYSNDQVNKMVKEIKDSSPEANAVIQ